MQSWLLVARTWPEGREGKGRLIEEAPEGRSPISRSAACQPRKVEREHPEHRDPNPLIRQATIHRSHIQTHTSVSIVSVRASARRATSPRPKRQTRAAGKCPALLYLAQEPEEWEGRALRHLWPRRLLASRPDSSTEASQPIPTQAPETFGRRGKLPPRAGRQWHPIGRRGRRSRSVASLAVVPSRLFPPVPKDRPLHGRAEAADLPSAPTVGPEGSRSASP